MALLLQIAGKGLILFGLASIVFGVYAILRLQSFYARIVVTSKIEAMGFTAVAGGAMLLSGAGMMSVKLLAILIFQLLTVAVGAHAIARSAWLSGHRLTDAPQPRREPDHG